MARYIDADKFEENKQYLRARLEFPDGTKTNGYWAVLSSVTIKDAQTEDVAPVVHAHWVYRGAVDDYHDSYTCSNCLCVEILTTRSKVSYCWNCGAKMDGEDTQETHKGQ